MGARSVKILVDSDPDGTAVSYRVAVKTDRYDFCRIPVETMEDAKELAGHIIRLKKGDPDRG